MKTKGEDGVGDDDDGFELVNTVIKFSFKNNKSIADSFSAAMEIHNLYFLVTISAMSYISPDNEKGVQIGELYSVISSVTDAMNKFNFGAVLNSMLDYGFACNISKEKDKALFVLANQQLGEYAKSELEKQYTGIAGALGESCKTREDFEKMRKAAESEMSDTKH